MDDGIGSHHPSRGSLNMELTDTRHLTEVEARLEKAEALIRNLRRQGSGVTNPAPAVSAHDASTPTADLEVDFSSFEPPHSTGDVAGEDFAPGVPPVGEESRQTQLERAGSRLEERPGRRTSTAAAHSSTRVFAAQSSIANDSSRRQDLVETPPREDFEWDELDAATPASMGSDAALNASGEGPIKDGMASLAVDEKDGGYLGVASGAALLRILEPNSRTRTFSNSSHPRPHVPMLAQPDPNRHITDTMIDAYFSTYHVSYPIVHEPTFRAQYSEVIPQPHGRSWHILAYIVAALGVYGSTQQYSDLEFQLFSHARSMLSFDLLEMGNSSLVSAITLFANYQQKRDKPNSGYNYLGLAVRMATGLGFHKEFPGWNISPLKMEMRRRIWWALCVFDVGATITFSRPILWPLDGVEVSFPLNVTDRELTANTKVYPAENLGVTPYTAVNVQARFHVSTNEIYSRVISKPLPTAEELLWLDQEFLEPWQSNLPSYFDESSTVPPKYAFAHAVMKWRRRNFRIIMYRPFVIRKALNARGVLSEESEADATAFNRCLEEAESTISMISEYWSQNNHNNLTAWYALYFLFQAALIPCICLRNGPFEPNAPSWARQIQTTLRTIKALSPSNSSASRCYQVIMDLCGKYLSGAGPQGAAEATRAALDTGEHQSDRGVVPETSHINIHGALHDTTRTNLEPISESPQTQLGSVFPMMWPNVNAFEVADEVMGDDAWLEFLGVDVRAGDPQL
ncbi:fungal-specific transcription factor domain-containing protein [Pestalotiopsis sp. NC0098]|nr:fungal-specific transcription factor domain-containing protein [Pestalotiopsis sp. NC0098]